MRTKQLQHFQTAGKTWEKRTKKGKLSRLLIVETKYKSYAPPKAGKRLSNTQKRGYLFEKLMAFALGLP